VGRAVRRLLGAQRRQGERPFLRGRLRTDVELRRDVEAATHLGVPVSRFRGEERAQATTYEYDEAGRLTRSVTIAEPAWSEDDRALALALLEEQAETCSICGHLMSECRDPATARKWGVVHEICQPGAVAQAYAEDYGHTRGLVVHTRRTDGGG
jgi:hypothetical protein